jgi:hypothetical protein
MASFSILSQHLHVGSEENYKENPKEPVTG